MSLSARFLLALLVVLLTARVPAGQSEYVTRPLQLVQLQSLPWTQFRPQDFEELPDGDLLLTATMWTSVALRLKPDGSPRWATQLRDFSVSAHSVRPDGNLVLAGAVETGGPDHYSMLVWLDADGKELRRLQVGGGEPADTSGYCNCDGAFGLVDTVDGGYLLVGGSTLKPGGPKNAPLYGGLDGWIIKVDHDGNREWDQSFGGSGYDILLRGARLPDGGFMLAGFSSSPADGSRTVASVGNNFWLIRTDSAGRQLWERSYPESGPPGNLTEFLVARDGDLLLAGGDSTLIRTAPDGTTRWVKKYRGIDQSLLREMPDGRLLQASALVRNRPGFPRVATFIRGVSAGGEILWEKAISGMGGNNEEAAALIREDGSIWFAGRDQNGLVVGQIAPENLPAAGPNLVVQDLPEYRRAHPGGYFSVNGPTLTRFVWETSMNLGVWLPLSTNVLDTHDLKFSPEFPGPAAQRFYRARPIP